MATGTVAVLMKIGFISEEMTKPRQLSRVSKILFSTVAVAYSYFFLHIAVFGPPVSEIFKGTFFMGVAVMSLLLFKSRQSSLREGFVWLDEFFALVSMVMLMGAIAVLFHWAVGGQEYFWRRYVTDTVWTVGIIGGVIGGALYFFEAYRGGRGDGLVISDVVYLAAAIASVTWWGVNLVELQTNMGGRVPAELVIFGTMMAGVSFEIARRIVGPLIPLLGFLFFIYSFEPIAQSLPGILEHPGNRTARVLEFLMLSTEGMLGLIVEVFATFIVIFVILGAFLEKTGLGALIINTTYRLTGQKTGGPGLAAVISSGFFGMISGSGVANVMTTGTFTIPLMKRVGYRPEFAGGVEAAASTGGAYMPPIMGAGAFLLAELTETSYFDIVKIAAIPALLYYLSVGLIVYFRARRDKLHGVPASELPSWDGILPRLHLLLPIPAMIFFLVIGDSAFLAAAKTIILIIMLKTTDLLVMIPTRVANISWRPYLIISLFVGVLVYLFGEKVGAPFMWFVYADVGIGIGDAGYWVLLTFILLKLGEILFIGRSDDPAHARKEITNAGVGYDNSALEIIGLLDVFKELVRTIWVSLEAGAKNTLVVSCIAGVLGILLSAATQSDLPGRVSQLLVDASFGLLPLTIFWVIVAGYIVGMGLPIVASYVILAIFAVGALAELGVPPIAAHMISYWVAVVSAVTPPVALAAYAASSIALSDPVKTGNQALKQASMILITPFLFVYTPLLLDSTLLDISISVAAITAGVFCWAKFLDGWGIGRPVPFERLIWLFCALCLLMPTGELIAWIVGSEEGFNYHMYALGALVMSAMFIYQMGGKDQPAAP
ncbi:MAG: hypothetical protein CMM45_00525 [Rhodospirillaceae bacterium]|nr:hypothetical protein [Rhodospirillaceae bacterium]